MIVNALDLLAPVTAAAEPKSTDARLLAFLERKSITNEGGCYYLELTILQEYRLVVDLSERTCRISVGTRSSTVSGPKIKLPTSDNAALALLRKIYADFTSFENNTNEKYKRIGKIVDEYTTEASELFKKYQLDLKGIAEVEDDEPDVVYLQVAKA